MFDSQFSVFFCLGIFGMCMSVYACGYVCIQWRANWKTVLFIVLLPPVENKTNLYICYFYFFFLITELMKSDCL